MRFAGTSGMPESIMASPAIVTCSIDALPCAVAAADARLCILAANAAFVERWTALGADPEVLSGTSLAMLYPPEQRIQLQSELWLHSARQARRISLTLTAPRAVIDLTPIRSEDGACWLVSLRDAVPAQEPSSNRMAIAALAHDLKMPVQAVLGWVSLLRRKTVDPARLDDVLRILERNALLEADMLNELLEVTRSQDGTPSLRPSHVKIDEVLRSTIDALRPLAEESGIQLRLRHSVTQPLVLGNARDFTRIVGNLIANAIKFSEAGSAVECEIAAEDGWVRLVVRDEGRGISAGFLPHVFDSFRREARGEMTTPEGLGIGLTAVRHLVQRYGGTVRAESEGKGRGSTFTVRLPDINSRSDRPARAASSR
jgi:signal transduction histidine kinase